MHMISQMGSPLKPFVADLNIKMTKHFFFKHMKLKTKIHLCKKLQNIFENKIFNFEFRFIKKLSKECGDTQNSIIFW